MHHCRTDRCSTSNDPYYPQQWALQKINAPEAWKTTTGSDDVIVAIAGVGIDVTHKDLAANIWTNTKEIPGNGKDDDGNGYIDDIHGWNGYTNDNGITTGGFVNSTRLASVIGAVGNNGLGVTGLNWRVKMMLVSSFSDKVNFYTSAGLIGSLDYILNVRKTGTNVRAVYLQQYVNTIGPFAEGDSIRALSDAGVLVVESASEGDVNLDVTPLPLQKLGLTNKMIVGASDADDNRRAGSGYGQKTVDIFAPGRNLLTTNLGSDTAITNPLVAPARQRPMSWARQPCCGQLSQASPPARSSRASSTRPLASKSCVPMCAMVAASASVRSSLTPFIPSGAPSPAQLKDKAATFLWQA